MIPLKLQIMADIEAIKAAYYEEDFDKVHKLSKVLSDNAAEVALESIHLREFEEDKKRVAKGLGTAHATHCCLEHGCKYGDDKYCTVMQGIEPQEIICPTSVQCDTYGDYDEEYDMHSNYKPY